MRATILCLLLPSSALALSQEETDAKILAVDEGQRNTGDYKALWHIEQREKGKEVVVSQAVIYRRDADDKLMILFVQPRAEAGKGYLRLDKNLFFYDPTVGKWERRTERERIGGSDSRRSDFDESRLHEEYDARFVADEKLGKLSAHRIKLSAKKGVEVAYPTVELWLDAATGNVLKRQELALSGKLMRSIYYPKWRKMYSESKKGDVYLPDEILVFDEVEKENKTQVKLISADLAPLEANIFTKAYLESKSR